MTQCFYLLLKGGTIMGFGGGFALLIVLFILLIIIGCSCWGGGFDGAC
ncbi:sporulation protein YjcZ [Bacillus pseudomycoides]|nr:sporulation protein YjcZ [Bacillus pseudomycoides]